MKCSELILTILLYITLEVTVVLSVTAITIDSKPTGVYRLDTIS